MTGGELTGAGTVAAEIAHLRRHAHTLTGNWARGDHLSRCALRMVGMDAWCLTRASCPRVGLYRTFHRLWAASGDTSATTRHARCRATLLLASGERFAPAQIAEIMEIPEETVLKLVHRARTEAGICGGKAVLIVTDAPEQGEDTTGAMVAQTRLHVAGVARTAGAALRLARAGNPDLLIADCRQDAAALVALAVAVLSRIGTRPVLFVTANPAALLRPDLPAATWILPLPCRQAEFRLALDQLLLFDAGALLSA